MSENYVNNIVTKKVQSTKIYVYIFDILFCYELKLKLSSDLYNSSKLTK